jgi:hypothetical protein
MKFNSHIASGSIIYISNGSLFRKVVYTKLFSKFKSKDYLLWYSSYNSRINIKDTNVFFSLVLDD